MESKASCILCDAAFLAATAERTGGKCMPCYNDRHGLRAAARLGASTPTAELLRMTEETTTQAALRVARCAATALADERIYGCWLFHTQFLSVTGITVFTEAGLERALDAYLARGSSANRAGLRWNPCDSPQHLYLPDEFAAANHLYFALEHQHGGDPATVEVERICLRTLRALRDASLFARQVVLTLAEGDQSFEERYAYAEQFSSPEALQVFRTDLQVLDEQNVEHWRSRIPSF